MQVDLEVALIVGMASSLDSLSGEHNPAAE